MSDILLSVGLQTGKTELSQIENDLNSIVAKLDKNPPKIKVGLQVDKAALSTFQNELTQIVNAVSLGNGSKITVNISGMGEITSEATKAKEAIEEVAKTAKKVKSLKIDTATKDGNRDVKEAIKLEKDRQALLKKSDTLLRKMRDAETKWTAARDGQSSESYKNIQDYANALDDLIAKFKNKEIGFDDFSAQVQRLDTDFSVAKNTIHSFGEDTLTVGEKIKGLADKFGTWLVISQTVMAAVRVVKQMVNEVVVLDTAMTELRKVTDETEATYDRFLNKAVDRAKTVGATLSDVVTATADFARLGHPIDEASRLADTAIVYKNVGDGIENISQASESIISTMQAFGIEANNAMSIVDKFNAVGNAFAISSTGIGEAMQRSAAAMNAAGNTIDETIALITAANTVVQNPDSVGTTMKTVSMFLRAAKTEAEEAGESTEGMANSVSELRDEILDLTGQKVDIQIDEDTFKSTYQIIKEISEVWDDLTNVSQANLLELMGGKRNSNVVSALIENFDIAEKVLKTSSDSAGSALAENEKYLDSIQGKIAQFQASWQALAATVVSSDLVKVVVDIGTALMGTITAIIDSLGGLGMALLAVPIMSFVSRIKMVQDALDIFKDVGRLLVGNIKTIVASISTASRAFDAGLTFTTSLSAGFSILTESMSAAQIALLKFAAVAVAILAVVGIFDLFHESMAESREKLENLKDEYSEGETELSSLNSELKTTGDRISELQSKGTLSFTEQEELANLQAQNAELERSIALLNAEQEIRQGKMNEQFVSTMDKSMEQRNYAGQTASFVGGELVTQYQYASTRDYIESQFRQYKDNQEYLAQLKEKYANNLDDEVYLNECERIDSQNAQILEYLIAQNKQFATDSAGISYIPDPTSDGDRAVNAYLDYISDFQDRLNIAMNAESAKKTALDRLTSTSFKDVTSELKELGKQGEVTVKSLRAKELQPFLQKLKELGVISDVTDESLEFLASYFNVAGNAAQTASTKISNIIQSFASLQASTNASMAAQIALDDVFADSTYITEEAYNAIAELAGGEDKLSECIDTTNGYLVTNVKMLNNIVDAADESLMANIKLAESNEMLNYHDLVSELYSVTRGMTSYDEATANTIAAIFEQINATQLQIAQYKLLEQQLLGVTNAFSELENAKAIDAAADYTDELSGAIGTLISSYEKHEFGTEAFDTAFKSLIPEDVYGQFEDVGDQIDAGWEYLNKKLSRYFSYENGTATIDYENVLQFVEDGLAGGYASKNAGFTILEGTLDDFDLNPEIDTLKEFADAFGITEEAAFSLATAISKYTKGNEDFLARVTAGEQTTDLGRVEQDIYACDQAMVDLIKRQNELVASGNINSDEWIALQEEIYAAEAAIGEYQQSAIDLMNKNIALDADIIDAKALVDSLKSELDTLNPEDSNYEIDFQAKFEDYTDAQMKLAALMQQKNALGEPTEMVIQVALEGVQAQIDATQAQIDAIPTKVESGVTVAVDPADQQALTDLQAKMDALNNTKASIEAYAGINEEDVMKSLTDIQEFVIDNKEFTVSMLGDAPTQLQGVIDLIAGINDKTVTITTIHETIGSSGGGVDAVTGASAYGNVHAYGNAHARGTVGTQTAEKGSLMGELGMETVVDPEKGIFYTVGDNGAEFVDLPKGAIIFNHKQTEGLLKYRKINSRGQALAFGNAHFNFSDKKYQFGSTTGTWGGSSGGSSSGSSSGGSSGGNYSSSSSSSSKEDDYNPFEEAYKQHQHYLAMEQESLKDYLNWLEGAYQDAYRNGYIELDDLYKYEEEVYDGRKELFDDYLNDMEHEISIMEREAGREGDIINMYIDMFNDINSELNKAYARGLTDNDDYVQELKDKQFEYADAIKDIQEDAKDDAMDAVEDLVEYRIKMLKQELENEKDALNDRLDALKDFYSDQKDLLKEAKEEEEYLEEQSEKRKAKSDIEAELAQLQFDDSAWAQKRKLELQAELAEADKDLADFEKDHAYDNTVDFLDKMLEKQEEQIQTQIDAIDAKLNDPDALYNKALKDIQNNTERLYIEMVDYNNDYGDGNPETVKTMWDEARESLDNYMSTFGQAYKNILLVASTNYGITGYASGTSSATPGLHKVFEQGDEYLFKSSDGNRYRVFSGGEKVLNAGATNFLYNFANSGKEILAKIFSGLTEAAQFKGVSPTLQPVQVNMGDIIVQGNASEKTVSEIRRAQREETSDLLKRLAKLNK